MTDTLLRPSEDRGTLRGQLVRLAEAATTPLVPADYLDLFAKTRAATLAKLESMSDAELDAPIKGGFSQFAPTVGSMFLFQADHTTMHSAQATPVRRKLGKPVLF